MSWHQGLSNPIPHFQQQIALSETPQPNPAPNGSLPLSNAYPTGERKRSLKSQRATAKVTWGALKNLSDQAQRQLQEQGLAETPENFLAAVITALHFNSVLLFCFLLLMWGVGRGEGIQHELNSPNLWIRHAAYMFDYHGKSVSLIYEPPLALASMSFLPTPFNSPELILSQLQNVNQSPLFASSFTQVPRFLHLRYQRALPGLCFCCHAHNSNFKNWPPKSRADRQWGSNAQNYTACTDKFYLWGSYNSSFIPNLALMSATMRQVSDSLPMFGLNASAVHGGSICANWVIKDPDLWFFFGEGWATNYHPGNYQCAAIGYLTVPVQVAPPVRERLRRKRDAAGPLGPSCSDEVIVDSQLSGGAAGGRAVGGALTGILTLGGYPGIISQENRRSILGLTCRLEKAVNATSRIIQDLQFEVSELHQIQLQHRLALDFLLARQGGFCKIVGQAGCQVQFHDLNKTIEDELAQLRQMLQDNTVTTGPAGFLSWLTSWLPELGWLRQAFLYGILAFALLVGSLCLAQCLPGLWAMRSRARETWQRRALYRAFYQLKNKNGEL